MRLLLWISLLLNVALIGFVGYTFMFGSVTVSDDSRTAIVLDKAEKSFVLKEMRGLVETTQGVLAALEENDMKTLGQVARKSGMADARNAPRSIMLKMPMGFKSLGHAMHKGWDTIAQEAEGMGDKDAIISLLAKQFSRCAACHGSYKLD